MKIYIVAFAPSEDSPNGVGGFDWYVHRTEAVKNMTDHLTDEVYDYHFMEKETPFMPGSHSDDATEWIEKNVELP